MTVEKLMQKRVIVTHHYPHCPFEIGQILTLRQADSEICFDLYEGAEKDCTEYASEVERSTANFRQLGWWEYRAVEDLPEYVSEIWTDDYSISKKEDRRIYKIHHWTTGEFTFGFESELEDLEDYIMMGMTFTDQSPATEADYAAYLKTLDNGK